MLNKYAYNLAQLLVNNYMNQNYTKYLDKCKAIAGERRTTYGDSTSNLAETVGVLDAMFDLKLTSQQICQVLIALKVARQKHEHSEDNILDIINYFCIELNENDSV